MALLEWEMLDSRADLDMLGLIPLWLNDEDERKAADQLDSHYQFGGFKEHSIKGFKKVREYCLKYPGDPLLVPLAQTELRGELIFYYGYGIIAVFQPDGSYVVARFD